VASTRGARSAKVAYRDVSAEDEVFRDVNDADQLVDEPGMHGKPGLQAGGALVAATRAPTVAFAVDAASFGISALTFWLIRRSPESRTETTEPEATGDPQAAEGSRK
jgi:hypothetical protein